MEDWLKWAMEIQSLAQSGLAYTESDYDRERYERLREISAEMLSKKTDISLEKIKELFCNEKGYQTPKIDTRAAVFKDNKILLAHENNGTWSLPGGWCDVLETVSSNTIKEVKEETGLNVVAKRIIAIQDINKHNVIPCPYSICKIFILCDLIDGEFVENIETTEIGYFDLENLPLLSENKSTKEQIKMCFEAYKNDNWKVQFD